MYNKINYKTYGNLLIGLAFLVINSCDVNSAPYDQVKDHFPKTVIVDSFDINILSYENLPNTMWSILKNKNI